uniref:Exoskeletal protein HACP44 n=4 Tax=Homarus americanus TaxID=6706 RepID=Q7M494_HOMAM
AIPPLVGASGIITPSGRLIQLPAGVTVASAGPSGAVLSNGDNIQYV